MVASPRSVGKGSLLRVRGRWYAGGAPLVWLYFVLAVLFVANRGSEFVHNTALSIDVSVLLGRLRPQFGHFLHACRSRSLCTEEGSIMEEFSQEHKHVR